MAVTSYKHGVTWSDVPTSIVAPVTADSGIPVFIGAAPVFQASSPAKPNVPRLYLTYEEAVAEMGFSYDFETYPLCMAMYTYFALFNVGPIILINVLDATSSRFKGTPVASAPITIQKGIAPNVSAFMIPSSLVIKDSAQLVTYLIDVDYVGAWGVDPIDGVTKYTVSAVPGGALDGSFLTDTVVHMSYDVVNPVAVTKTDIIGGIDITTGFTTGIEAIEDVFPLFGVIPGVLQAPFFSQDPEVAAVLASKAADINGCFRCITLCDIDSETILKAIDVNAWKNTNNFTDPRQGVLWPRVGLDEKDIWLSVETGARILLTDNNNNNIPVETPSNKLLKMNKTLVGDYGSGTEVVFSKAYGDMLNGQGVLTAINWIGGWKAWGSNMACYPGVSTDPKDRWMPARRMTDYVGNTLVLTIFQFVDRPANRRLIDTVIDTVNVWLNSLVSSGNSLGCRVEFRVDENSDTNLIDGHYTFHVYEFFPLPAEWIEFKLELDVSYLSALFTPITTAAA